ncbi:hypothetical protein [Ezakiella peruensis]|uniref:hypothetical protein n=1 Tax=Ezakiella peruensis TaxID=1464038 RepID=UPI000C1B03C8|nr:hypothetical protein [Ezakiella peruensis]
MNFVIKTAIGNLKITCEDSHIIRIEMTDENENKNLNKMQNEIKKNLRIILRVRASWMIYLLK